MAALPSRAATSTLNSAKVTQIQNSVLLQEGQPSANTVERPATVGDMVVGTRTLVTGKQSRAELLFNDDTIARLGANSIFSFKPGSRDIDLKSGFLLLHTPKGHGGAKITTPTAAASVLGTTIMMSALPDGGMKLVVLEGTASITQNGVTQMVGAGQLVFITKEQGMSPPINIDLGKLVASSGLINNLTGSIGSENLINEAISTQTEKIADGQLQNSGITIGGDQNGLKVVNNGSDLEAAIKNLTNLDINQSNNPPAPSNIEDVITGVLHLTSDFTIDYNSNGEGLALIKDSLDQVVLMGINDLKGTTSFVVDRLLLTSKPQKINQDGVLNLSFVATGKSVDYVNSFNAIIFDHFTDEGGDNNNQQTSGPTSLFFGTSRGGVQVLNSTIHSDGFMNFGAFGGNDGETGNNSGNVDISESVLGRIKGNGESEVANSTKGILLESNAGNVQVTDKSTLLTGSSAPAFLGEGQNNPEGIFLAALQGNVNVTDSLISTRSDFVEMINYDGQQLNYPGGTPGQGIYISANNSAVIDNSTLQAQSEATITGQPYPGGNFASNGSPIQVLVYGAQGQISVLNNSKIDSAIGSSAGPIMLSADQKSGKIKIDNSILNAASTSGATAPVSVVAHVVDLTNVKITGSTVAIGNFDHSATINFHGDSNYIYTNTGTDGFFRNGTQTGNVQVGTIGQTGLQTVTPTTPVGGITGGGNSGAIIIGNGNITGGATVIGNGNITGGGTVITTGNFHGNVPIIVSGRPLN